MTRANILHREQNILYSPRATRKRPPRNFNNFWSNSDHENTSIFIYIDVIIADLLHSKGIDYQYEAPLVGKGGTVRYPDFSFEDEDLGLQFYWEHLGMLSNPEYRRRWEAKLVWYREQGILPYKEDGGPEGTLIVTQDDERGGIQSDEIERLIDKVYDV